MAFGKFSQSWVRTGFEINNNPSHLAHEGLSNRGSPGYLLLGPRQFWQAGRVRLFGRLLISCRVPALLAGLLLHAVDAVVAKG
jgi:hypothetical protein